MIETYLLTAGKRMCCVGADAALFKAARVAASEIAHMTIDTA